VVHISPALPWDFLESIGAARRERYDHSLLQKLRLVGGGGVFPVKLCQALSKRIEVDLVAPAPYSASFQASETLRIHLTKAYYGGPFFSTSNPYAMPPGEVMRGCDAVHVHQIHKAFSNTAILSNQDAPVYVTHHAGDGLSLDLYAAYRAHLAVSNYASKLYHTAFARSPVIFGGADPDPATGNGDYIDPLLEEHEGPILLFVGVFRRNKRITDLIDATALLAERGYDPLLVLCGEPWSDGEMTALRATVPKGHENNVIFTSHLTEKDKQYLYGACDLFVSASQHEYLGLVFIEAMMHAKPVIALEIGGIPDVVVHGKTGYLVNGSSTSTGMESFTEKIASLLNRPGLLMRMGKAGLIRAHRQFTWDKVAERTLSAYKRDSNT
jgi:glycosyltransferase involved in cell wall biosynthesis